MAVPTFAGTKTPNNYIMKHLFLSLLLCVATSSRAQVTVINTSELNAPRETLDSAYLKISYSLRFVKDTAKPQETDEDEMLLLAGKSVSQYFSYARYQADSLMRTLSPEQVAEFIKDMKRGKFSYDIYKNHPSGNITTTDRIGMTNYKYEEPYERQNWEIAADTMNILGYACQKATCTFRGRDYVAWFTADIPVSNGPWKFAGLPGLILNVADTENHYVFECSGIETPAVEIPIEMDKKNYANVSKKDFNKVYERFLKDPVGFLSSGSSGGTTVKVTMRNSDGTPAKSQTMPAIPYNPIER